MFVSHTSLLSMQEQQGPLCSQNWKDLTHKEHLSRGPRGSPPFPAIWIIV